MTTFTSAVSEATAVRKNVFENGIGKSSSTYGKTWTNVSNLIGTTNLDTLLRSDYCVTFSPASDWNISSTTGKIIVTYKTDISPWTSGGYF